MSQRDQVLAMLKAAGPAGVHSFERLHGEARGCRYRLLDRPAAPVTPVAGPVADTPLFTGPVPLDVQYGTAA